MHAVADEGVPFREIAELIGRRLDVPAISVAPEQASSTVTQKRFADKLLVILVDAGEAAASSVTSEVREHLAAGVDHLVGLAPTVVGLGDPA